MYRNFINTVLVLVLISFLQTTLLADVGMWMPHQMKMLKLESKGLKMNPDELYKPDGTGLMSAVVDLGGGTGSFVSDKGLIFTNHHVAFGALQRASKPEHNYLQNGFLAGSFAEEIQAPGYIARVLFSYEEVTKQVQAELNDDMSAIHRYEAIELAKKKLVQEAESKGPDLFSEVASAYSGNQYYRFVYKYIKDVRIVYAPPKDLGNFGGETDNWMWPRHTCDFTFLRAYVSPTGEGAEYAADNIPYQPKVHFRVAENGVKDGDFTFIMGYPGKTYRNYSSPELLFDIDILKQAIEERLVYIAFLEEASKKSEAIEIKYASTLKGLYNGLKNYRGKLEGFATSQVVNKKEAHDRQFIQWAKGEKERAEKYAGSIDQISRYLQSEYKDNYFKERDLKYLTYSRGGAALLSQAYLLVRIVLERLKPDMERDAYYQERSMPRLIRTIKLAERGYDLDVDKDYTILRLERLADAPEDRIFEFIKSMTSQPDGISGWVANAFKKTKLNDPEYRLSLIDKSVDELKALNDPLLDCAFEMEEERSEIRIKKNSMQQQLSDLKKVYIKGLMEMTNNQIASDANSTIRFTYGPVKGYAPRDALYYEPISTLKGVIEKDTGEPPFRVPDKIKKLYETKDFGNYISPELEDIPACFLNTTNVTGGNSGSPTIDANGDIVGIVFDMTYESVTGDYYIIPELQRSINADIRYILFVTDKFSGATNLIKEIGL